MDRTMTKSLAPVALSDESLTAASGASGFPVVIAPVIAPKINNTIQTNTGVQVVIAPFAGGPVTALLGQSNVSGSVNL